jgi:hypothetical protein
MEENMNYVTNVVLPNGETVYVKDEDALHQSEYASIKQNMETIHSKLNEVIGKLSNMAYNISDNDGDPSTTPTDRPSGMGPLSW